MTRWGYLPRAGCEDGGMTDAPVLTVEQASALDGRLAFAGVDPVRNARRCMHGIVQEITQAEPPRTEVDPDHIRKDTVGCYLAVLEAIDELAQIRNDLAPYAKAARADLAARDDGAPDVTSEDERTAA